MHPSARPFFNRGPSRRLSWSAAIVAVALLVTGSGHLGNMVNLFQADAAEAAVPLSVTDETKVPHYFGPYPNWANSPQTLADAMVKISVGAPTPVLYGNPLIERKFATDYAKPTGEVGPVLVVLDHTKLPAGTLNDFQSWNQGAAGSSPTTSAGNLFHALVLRPTGAAGEYTVVFASDELKVATPTVATGEVATYPMPAVTVQQDDVIGFYGQGIPVDTDVLANGDTLSTPASGDRTMATNIAPAKDSTVTLGAANYPDFSHDRTYSFGADVTPTIADPGTGAEATATVDPKTGAIASVTVTSPGAGYAVPPTVEITTGGVIPTEVAKATATIATGVITGIDVNETGFGFSAPSVTLTGGNPTAGAEAKALASGIVDDLKLTNGGKGYQVQPLVNISKPDLADGQQATASATMDANGVVTGVAIANGGSGYTSAPTVTLTDASKTAPTQDAVVVASIGVTRIDIIDGGAGYASTPTVTIADTVGTADKGASATAKVAAKGSVTDIVVTTPGAGYLTPGIKKFVDTLPGEGEANANDLGQYIPVAVPDTTTYPGTDYYEIAVVQYRMKFHRDLPATLLRGYVQLSTSVVPGKKVALGNANLDPSLPDSPISFAGVDNPHYLGPTIVATKDKPVRVLFRNLLPTGVAGDLFLPVDTTVMGAGAGPSMMTLDPTTKVPMDMATDDASVLDGVRNPMCGETPKPTTCYSENRATLHLHGGITPWISDGTPHQWVTPTGENTAYPKGVSVSNVPDMPDPGPGAETFFYTNQQSARMMFYHDHSWGITRLNVYAGEEAGYLITDDTEKKLIAPGGALDGLGMGTSLTIQDKTFVPSATRMAQLDPTWDEKKWGGEGNLWQPHVYMPAQNPGDPSGMSSFGRWFYGPWFWPPAKDAKYPPMANPYYDPTCDPNTADFCEPALIPSTPNNSVGMEAFHDTPVVNGTVYPTTTMEPKSYRFRILNGSDDRFWNLSWYVADPATGTEVALKASEVAMAQTDPVVTPTPDTTKSPKGPDWIQIGNEGGFLPTPAVVPAHETTWITDPTRFDVGNVDQHSLLLAPAERADVIVDFSAYRGKTLILYNDAPAAFPARIPGYDYYTGGPDMSPAGAPSTLPGYGPDTRSVMQVKVSNSAPAVAFDRPNTTADRMGALMAAFDHHVDAAGKPAGVFESGQDPIVVGQAAYNQAYGTSFVSNGYCNSATKPAAKCDGFSRIAEQGGDKFKFDTLSGAQLSIPIEGKGIHDEMNSANFDEWGRMSANIGLEAPGATPLTQNIILYPYVNPVTEKVDGTKGTNSLNVTPISTNADGTQIWKITHNGVDTHPIHFHLNDVQVINRVTWDNIIIPPEPNELGWKDTVRVSPLEDTIVAVRPILPKLPFGILDSVRPLNPMMPLGAMGSAAGPTGTEAGFNNTDTGGNPIAPISNDLTSFGWEYVWHCHILSHEEMDMMRPISVSAPRTLPDKPVASFTRPTNDVLLNWTDGTPVSITDPTTWGNAKNEVGYKIDRAPLVNGTVGAFTPLATALANATSYVDKSAGTGQYAYQVTAFNAAGNAVSARVLTAATTVRVTATNPASGATGVSTNVRPTVVFSEPVTGISNTTFTLKQGATAVPATVTYNAATMTATLSPTRTLTADRPYTLSLTTAIKGVAGVSVAATSWNFITGPSPTVIITNPAAGATGIGLGTLAVPTPLSATFSEPVTGLPTVGAATPNFTLKLGAVTIASKVTYSAITRVATLTSVAPLIADSTYTLSLTSAIQDAAGNPLTAKTWTFITGPAPVVTARTPAVNAVGVSRTANITATFSEAVAGLPVAAAASGNFTIRRTSNGVAFPSVVSYSAATRVATLNPTGTLLARTQYTVTLSSGITDTAGNLLAPVSWSFTTGP
jgi:FtsP/CotA-like multicopper oxidase with cupredoxin domain